MIEDDEGEMGNLIHREVIVTNRIDDQQRIMRVPTEKGNLVKAKDNILESLEEGAENVAEKIHDYVVEPVEKYMESTYDTKPFREKESDIPPPPNPTGIY